MPVKTKKRKPNWIHKAGLAWPILARTAKDKDTITYKELGGEIGEHHRNVRWVLGVIQQYCLDAGHPPLTGIVLSKTQKKPGAGFIAWDIDDLNTALALVYARNWSTMINPFAGFGSEDTVEKFAAKLINNPASSGDVYRQVRDRGIAQRIFRQALLDAYGYRCAICDLGYEEALEAAHVVSFAECTMDQRIAVTNGVLLCANHHKLYDSGWLNITAEFLVSYWDADQELGYSSAADDHACTCRHGQKLRLPEDPRLHPIIASES